MYVQCMPSLYLVPLSPVLHSGHEVSSQIVQQGLGVCRGKVFSALDKTKSSGFPTETEEEAVSGSTGRSSETLAAPDLGVGWARSGTV